MIRAVFLDAGDTLIRPNPCYGAVYERVTAEFGMRVPAAFFDDQLAGAFAGLDSSLKTTPDLEFRRWTEVTRRIHAALPSELPFDPWFRGVYRAFADAAAWTPSPGARETLAGLRNLGIATGVISNWDDRLFPVLQGLHLKSLLDHVFVAPWVGWRKPAPEIFRAACAAAHVAPHEALHVGDSPSEDVDAARHAGLQALLFNPQDPTALRSLSHLLHHPALIPAE